MKEKIIDCGNGFWNIRGSFKLAGLIDLGTQTSLLRMGDGRFVILDSYSYAPETLERIDAITGGRDKVAAVINLHPFHTLHTETMRTAFPEAVHFGTSRHIAKFPHLDWAATASEDPATWALFKDDLAFSVPAGVALVPGNENIHAGSVLAYHPASRVIHVDDTFNLRGAKPGKAGKLSVHPTLSFALEKRAGAARDFEAWGEQLLADWADAEVLCVAHAGVLRAEALGQERLVDAMAHALSHVDRKLRRHARRYG
ncbi:hypothetical protein [Maritimibacter sp. DP1N21-5]|uniref:hypothetical protein n=1 Tax=Maritimibacter sp. DP1N21-5 TaxID=2836867 RepID=UPI001C4582FA|nr:hypothetical protein [Maritimibacter sp. DP1N21-5]MBV7409700.1 hypothetical protein [Maritimibacter sp. DP1N21-5]